MYLPVDERKPDSQYKERILHILQHGERIAETPQDVGALTCFGKLAPLVYPVENGAPIIPDRKIGFWKKPIGELFAFINGVRDVQTMEHEYGVGWWKDWATERKCAKIGVSTGDLGPGSYGAAFHDFPMPDGGSFDQFAHVVEMLKNPEHHKRRTIFVSPWIPFYNGWGSVQKAVVSPCHGWVHLRVMNGGLKLHMIQRSADMPVGVPSNMIQYFALLLAIAQVTGLTPVSYHHSFSDAHIYEDQVDNMRTLVDREAKRLPTLLVDEGVKELKDFRPHHFALYDYDPHPAMSIPVGI